MLPRAGCVRHQLTSLCREQAEQREPSEFCQTAGGRVGAAEALLAELLQVTFLACSYTLHARILPRD